ncbi:MAG: MarC family protein [Kiritimatiellae bacterium]|nr:MarC family protein [Kiritimatiellia bacterium]
MVEVLTNALYLLALINPVSKVSVLLALSGPERAAEAKALVAKSSLIAMVILLGSMVFGHFILRSIFHVSLDALRIAGGAILFWVGFNALRKGVFFEQPVVGQYNDLAIVPLACPMIAGPATIAAGIGLWAHSDSVTPIFSLLLALSINYLIMRWASGPIYHQLHRINILGALIRITGLIVMTIGTQMALDGIGHWMTTTH